jgi:hypothetical protein
VRNTRDVTKSSIIPNKQTMSKFTVTWVSFCEKTLATVSTFEDPVYSNHVIKELFIEMYEPLLVSLDGSDMTSFVDLFFEPSPIDKSRYIFKDEDAK